MSQNTFDRIQAWPGWDRTWLRLRALPRWVQIVGWLAFAPFLAALYFWRRPNSGRAGQVVAALFLMLGTVWYAAAATLTSNTGNRPKERPSGGAYQPSLIYETDSPEASPAPTPSESPSLSPLPSASTSDARRTMSNGIPAGAQKARVAKNVDGDTIWAEPLEAGSLASGATHKIRLLEIDTPEIYGSTVECYGPEASAFARQEIPVGSNVFLLRDKEDKDRYGRFLRYLWKGNSEFYNDKAVRLGYARAVLYMPNDLYIAQLRAAEAEARAAKRGLWGACSSGGSAPGPSQTTSAPSGNCHPSYPDFCIPPPPPDLDCPDIDQKNFTVRWDVADPDPHRFDGDKDGIGCET